MKTKKIKTIVFFTSIIIIIVSLNMCGGSSSTSGGNNNNPDGDSTVSLTFTPSSSDEAVSSLATVSATFSGAITEPLSWYNLITLKKNGTGDTLCTSVSYDSTNKTISCGHEDLDENSSYTVVVAGVTDSSGNCVDDATSTFETSGAVPVASVSKTTMTSESGGTVAVTFNFSEAISSSITPSVSVSSDDDASVSAGSCTFNGGRTSCTTTISSVAGCDTPTDYLVILSMDGFEDYQTYFNSADNEFEDADTVADNDCWIKDQIGDEANYSWTATGGKLRLKVLNTSSANERNIYYDNVFASDKEGAFAVHVANLDTLATSGDTIDLILVQATNSDFSGLNGIMSGYNGNVPLSGWNSVYQESEDVPTYKFGVADGSGDLPDKDEMSEDYYVCQTAYNNVLTTYISTDGENYIKLSEDNMECSDGGSGCDLDQIDSRTISSWDDLRLSLQVGSDNDDGSFYADFGFARFRTSNLNGSMADCPRMTR